MTEKLCKERVWSNGDKDPCGAPAVAAGFCAEHLSEEITIVRERITEKEQFLVEMKAALALLESARERLVDALLRQPVEEP